MASVKPKTPWFFMKHHLPLVQKFNDKRSFQIGTLLRRNETENRGHIFSAVIFFQRLYFFSGFSGALLKIDMKIIERKKKTVN